MTTDNAKITMQQMALMLKAVTGHETACDGDYLQLKADQPEALYATLHDDLSVMHGGDFSGVTIETKQAYKTEEKLVVDREGYQEPAGRDMCDNWEDEHWVEAETHYEPCTVPDGLDQTIHITTSKRADIRKEEGTLFLAKETIDPYALKKCYDRELKESPVVEVLSNILGAKKAKSLMDAFNAVASLKPLSVEQMNDKKAVKALQDSYAAAVAGIREAINDSGLLALLPKGNVQVLVKRATKLDMSF